MNMKAEYELHVEGLGIGEDLYTAIMAGDVGEWGLMCRLEEILPETVEVLERHHADYSIQEFSVQRYDSEAVIDIRLKVTLDVDGWFDADDGSLDEASSDTLRGFEDGLISAAEWDGGEAWYEFCGIDEEYDEYSYAERED